MTMKRYKLDLLAVPNQRFDTMLNGQNLTFELRTIQGLCLMSISQNGEYIVCGIKCVPNTNLLRGEIARLINGNIMFECVGDEYPNYSNFSNNDCNLIFISNE